MRVSPFIPCLLALAVFSAPQAMAASRTWDGGGANTNWSTAANWDVLPVANDDLTFNGTTRLTNNNNLTANTTFTGIAFASGAGAFVLGGNQITLGGSVFNYSTSLQTINLNMILSGQPTFSAASGKGDFLVNGILSGTGGFIKGGSGTTLTLGSANTHTGETWLQNGSLQLNNVNALQNSALRFESTGSMVFGANGGVASTYNIGQLKGSSAVVGIDMGANTLSVGGNNGTYTYAGMLSGTGNFIKVGTGTLGLTNTGTSYSGNLSVKQGTLSINSINNASANGTLGNSANSVSLGNTGGVTGTLAYTAGNATSNKKFTMAAGGTGAFDVSTTGTNLGLSGVIDGSGNMSKTGTGTLTLTGTNTYTGTTTISAGTLQVGAGTDSGSIASSNGIVNNGDLVYNVGSGNRTYENVISGNGTLTQNSAGGILTLTGNSTYGGTTTVTAGTLLINGNNSGATGAFNVASGATLGGDGIIGGITTIYGNLNPGNSPGTITFGSGLTLDPNSTSNFEIAGIGFDKVVVTGAINFGGILNLDNTGYTAVYGNSVDLFDWTGASSGSFTTITSTPLGGGFSWDTSAIYTTGVIVVVPEPSTWALVAFSLTAVVIFRRRRQG